MWSLVLFSLPRDFLSEKRSDVFMEMGRDTFKYFYFVTFNLLVTLKIQRTPFTVTGGKRQPSHSRSPYISNSKAFCPEYERTQPRAGGNDVLPHGPVTHRGVS